MTDVERLQRELHALIEIAKTLVSPLDLPELLNAVIQKLAGVIGPAEAGAVMLWDRSSGLFQPAGDFGYSSIAIGEPGLRPGESIIDIVYDQGVGHLFNTPEHVVQAMANIHPSNRADVPRAQGCEELTRCVLAVPISTGTQKLGVLVLETIRGPAIFSEVDLSFLQTIADLVALVIDRDHLAAQADAIREERQVERMRSEVLATLSHELRMPLTAIQGYSTALLMDEVGWSDEKRREFLRLIEDECNNMQTMLKDILDSSLIDVDQLVIERHPTHIPTIAQAVAEEFQRRTESHRIMVDFAAKFPILDVDARWIKQVFRNILDNAVKYSPDGGLIVIRGEVRPRDIVIVIADQGIGISPENLIPLFERFYRVRSSANLNIPGTGLGLPIARAIVEAHGGRIWAESKLSEGTTIYFSLPKSPEVK